MSTVRAPHLKLCPASGEGVHRWVYYAACICVDAGLTNDEAEEIIEAMMTRDPSSPSEIMDALRSARGERAVRSPRWTPANTAKIAEIAKQGPTLIDLISRSSEPIRFGEASRSDAIIDALFPGNPWLCVGKSDRRFYTDKREAWRGHLQAQSLIVPSPMSAQRGRSKQGKLSYHSDANTGPRRFLVIEFDKGTLDQQAALVWHLAEMVPFLALIVFSGNRSLHSWFFCEGQPEDKLQSFFSYAHSLGACDGMWKLCQFARMPDGRRSDGKISDALAAAGVSNVPKGRQAVLYFNPGVIR